MFVDGYNVFTSSTRTASLLLKRLMNQGEETYVPVSDYKALSARVTAIEHQLAIPQSALFQVIDDDGEDDEYINVNYVSSEYVTQEEFNELEAHVKEIEEVIHNDNSEIFVVKE